MPLQATSGAASYDAFGGGVAAVPKYIEDYFSTFLYSGTGSAQTITNNIDLSTKGGLVWLKARNDTRNNWLYDTVRGKEYGLRSDLNFAENYSTNSITAFNNNGFSIGDSGNINTSGNNLVSWSFAKAPKFFDVVTYTGTGSARTVAHNLGSVPGCIMVKSTSGTGAWVVYHRGVNGGTNPQNYAMTLNATAAQYALTNFWNDTAPTSTVFTVGAAGGETNETGVTYVAYLFAHNAGGFGLTGTDNVISCGSFTTDGSGYATVNLGYEPQWILWKRSDGATNWFIADSMRGLTTSDTTSVLSANLSNAEDTGYSMQPLSTGFKTGGAASATYIYIAIRRGPMKVPTSGTSVFSPVAYSGTGATRTITAGFPVDLAIPKSRGATGNSAEWYTRLIGPGVALLSAYTFQELARPTELTSFASNTGVVLGTSSDSGGTNASGSTYVDWNFRRAPSFFDEVCYTGTGSVTTFSHNLGVVPELMIVKRRSASGAWMVNSQYLAADARLELQSTSAVKAPPEYGDAWNNTRPTSTVFTVGTDSDVNASGGTYVNYLFATCAGVQYINSYVGDGTTGRTINCGFTGGARFVCIKATSTSGSWWTFDSARGIVTNSDPALQLNSTAAEVTSADAIDTASSGFIVNQEATCSLNASGVTYLVWAIA